MVILTDSIEGQKAKEEINSIFLEEKGSLGLIGIQGPKVSRTNIQ